MFIFFFFLIFCLILLKTIYKYFIKTFLKIFITQTEIKINVLKDLGLNLQESKSNDTNIQFTTGDININTDSNHGNTQINSNNTVFNNTIIHVHVDNNNSSVANFDDELGDSTELFNHLATQY